MFTYLFRIRATRAPSKIIVLNKPARPTAAWPDTGGPAVVPGNNEHNTNRTMRRSGRFGSEKGLQELDPGGH